MPIDHRNDHHEVNKVYDVAKPQKATAAKANWHSSHSSVVGAIFKGICNAFVETFFSSTGNYKERLHFTVGDKHALSDKYHRYDFACKSKLLPGEKYRYQEVTVNSVENRHGFTVNREVFISVPSVAKRLNISIKKARNILISGDLNELLTHKYNTFRNEVNVLDINLKKVNDNIDEVWLVERNNHVPEKKRFRDKNLNAILERSEVYANWMKGVIDAYKDDNFMGKLNKNDIKKIDNICKEIAWLEATAKKSKKTPESLLSNREHMEVTSKNTKKKPGHLSIIESDTDKQVRDVMIYLFSNPDLVDEMHNAYRTYKEEKKAVANSIKV